LAACGAGPPVLVERPIPPGLLTCQARPDPPLIITDDQQLALWITELDFAGEDCRAKLESVKGLLNVR
jgi:hypothetical protein